MWNLKLSNPRNCCDRIWEKGRKESQTGEELVVQLRGPRGHNLYLIPPRKNALQYSLIQKKSTVVYINNITTRLCDCTNLSYVLGT